MTCRDLEEVLSAYADGELSGPRRDFIERHLSDCPDCQQTLADYRKIGEGLLALRATGRPAEIAEATMSRIRRMEPLDGRRRWLRPVLVATPVLVVLATVLSLGLSGAFRSGASIFSEVRAAAAELTSYRVAGDTYDVYPLTEVEIHATSLASEYVLPDSYHMTLTFWKSDVLGEWVWIVMGGRGFTIQTVPERFEDLFEEYEIEFPRQPPDLRPLMDDALQRLDSLLDVERLPDEEIDGVACLHYVGTVDTEKLIAEVEASLTKNGQDTLSLEDRERMERVYKTWRASEMTEEFWIGKTDSLIRQFKNVTHYASVKGGMAVGAPTKVAIVKYYDFNADIVIEPPLDESGELLPLWREIEVE